jgi:diamine N-acetyltransferase
MTTADFPAILSLIREFAVFQKTPEKVTITEEGMRQNKDLFQGFVAELPGGAIAGFASFFFAYYSWSGKALYLDDLYVRAESRGSGIGKALLLTLVEQARGAGCIKMRWQVSQWNEHAIHFYRSLGAEVDGTELNCDLKLK